MSRFDPAELDEIRARIALPELIASLGVELKKKGREYLGLCPFHNERTPSFTVVPGQFWHCFGCGAHGDAISFLMRIKGIEFAAAVETLADRSGLKLGRMTEAQKAQTAERARLEAEAARRERAQATADAREIWATCHPAGGTLVQTYLEARGIEIAALGGVPPTLRYHPALRLAKGDHRPAMVAAVQDPAGAIAAVHRTFLSADGAGKADVERPKRMFGPVWQGAVRLTARAAHMLIAEGIETSLSVLVSLRKTGGVERIGPDYGVWAALSLGNIAGSGDVNYFGKPHPRPSRNGQRLPTAVPDMTRPGVVLPAGTKLVTVCADADNRDPEAAEALLLRAAARWQARGICVRIARPPAGMDFNDLLAGAA